MSTRNVFLAGWLCWSGLAASLALDLLFQHWHPAYRPFMMAAFLAVVCIGVFRSNWAYYRRGGAGTADAWRSTGVSALVGAVVFAVVFLALNR